MKKVALFLVLVFLTCQISVSAQGDIGVLIDSVPITFDVPPQIIDGRTMVPMRAIFEYLGATVLWDQATQTATASKDATVVSVTLNSNIITINGVEQIMDISPCLIDNRTLVPVRFVSEAFDLNVTWDNDNRNVVITSQVVSPPVEEVTPPVENVTVYSEAPIPFAAYTTVIEATLIDVSETEDMHTYTYNNYTGFSVYSYLMALVNDGWIYTSTVDNTPSVTYHYEKENKEIIITEDLSKNIVYISFYTNTYYAKISANYTYYNAVVPFPTYDSVTQSSFIQFVPGVNQGDSNVAVYQYSAPEIFHSYLYALQDLGWRVYNTEDDAENYIYNVYMYKNGELIAVSTRLLANQVWIIYK